MEKADDGRVEEGCVGAAKASLGFAEVGFMNAACSGEPLQRHGRLWLPSKPGSVYGIAKTATFEMGLGNVDNRLPFIGLCLSRSFPFDKPNGDNATPGGRDTLAFV